jgi:hypothetical protein
MHGYMYIPSEISLRGQPPDGDAAMPFVEAGRV